MKIILASINQTKIEAFQEAVQFLGAKGESCEITRNSQLLPFSEEETLCSAIFSAKKSCQDSKSDFGLALEDGVIELGSQIFAVCWGAIVDKKGNLFTCSSARIPLPVETANLIRRDQMLAHSNAAFIDQAIQKSIGAIGILTSGMNTLKDEYIHMIRILVGQFQNGKNYINASEFAGMLVSPEFHLA